MGYGLRHGILDFKREIVSAPSGPPSGHTLWLKFEDNVTDTDGNYTFSASGTPTYSDSSVCGGGKAYNFASSRYITSNFSGTELNGYNEYTFSWWVKYTQSMSSRGYFWGACNSGGTSSFGNESTGITFARYTGNAAGMGNCGHKPNDGNWHMITCIYNNSTLEPEIWVDAVKGTQLSGYGTGTYSVTVSGSLVLGRLGSYGGLYYTGLMDSFMFWPKKLTSSEVSQLYNGGSGW